MIFVDTSGIGGTPPERALALKLRLTELRANLDPDVPIALRLPVDPELTVYADVLVGDPAWHPRWPAPGSGGCSRM